MLYRIITERKQVDMLAVLIGSSFPSFTLLEARGYWQGKSEQSVIVEIDTETEAEAAIVKLANDIRLLNSQEAVLVQRIASRTSLHY